MNSRTQDFNLCASLGLQDAVKEWAEKNPGELKAALTNLNQFNQTGKTPRGSKIYFPFFVDMILRSSLGPEEAGKIAFDVLTDYYSEYLEKGSRESRWVLNTLCSPRYGEKPKPYYEMMIRTIAIALSEMETLGFAAQLSAIHPELCKAVNDFLTGKLQIPDDCEK